MEFLEKDLEQIIWEADNDLLIGKGLSIYGVKKRQLRIGNYGVADIVTFSKNYDYINGKIYPFLDITVYELKKEKVGIGAFLQAIRYCKGIQTFLQDKRKNYINFKLHIVLASKEVDTNSDFIYITDLFNSNEYFFINSVNFYSFKYTINGIEFQNVSNYNLINKGF